MHQPVAMATAHNTVPTPSHSIGNAMGTHVLGSLAQKRKKLYRLGLEAVQIEKD